MRAAANGCPSARQGAASGGADRQGQGHAKVARADTTGGAEHFAGAAGRRTRLGTRSLCALSAFLERPAREAVSHGGGGEPGARARHGAVRRERDGQIEPGAFDQAAGGTLYLNGLEDLSADAQRAYRAPSSRTATPGWRPRDGAARRPLGQLGAGRLRGPGGAGAVPEGSHRPSERHHAEGAPAARLCGGRARTCCATTWTGWSTISICRCGASALPRKTACGTIPGPATSGTQEPGAARADLGSARRFASRRSSGNCRQDAVDEPR